MATIVTGTTERSDRHSMAIAPLGLVVSMGVPVAVIVAGVADQGWRRTQDDPGPAATNFGSMTPVGSLVEHLVWGVVLGLLYSAWPLG